MNDKPLDLDAIRRHLESVRFAAGIGPTMARIVHEDVPALIAEVAQLRTLVDDIYHFHTDSPAGVCPSCGRIDEQSDTDDGLVNWPCPTVQAIERVVGDHTGCPPVVEDRELTTASRSVAAARRLLGLDGTG